MTYVYAGVAIAFTAMLGIIGYQNGKIDDLEKTQVLYESKNQELAADILRQNLELRDGEEKFKNVQKNLDIASGKNMALTNEYGKLRDSWKQSPVPVDCPSAIGELKQRTTSIVDNWNKNE